MEELKKIFEKIVYESEEYEKCQAKIDSIIRERITPLLDEGQCDCEHVHNELNDIIYLAEQEVFALGVRYGIALTKNDEELK